MRTKQSPVWNYFQRIDTGEHLQAKCLINGCTKVLKTPLSSTSTLIRHLRDAHKMQEFTVKEALVHRPRHKKIPRQLKTKLDHAVVAAIIEDGRSFGDFAKNGFKKFIQLALPSEETFVAFIYLLCSSICII